jgi:Phosphotransferase enzyme family
VNARARLDAEATTVLGEPAVSVEPLPHSRRNTATLEVWRVRTAEKRAVVKVVSTDPAAVGLPGTDNAAHGSFVAREPLLFERGLPAHFTDAGIAMPRLLGSVDRPGAIALWLEDLDGASGRDLTVADYATIGRRLGHAQGRELAGAPLARTQAAADFPWSRGFLELYLASWDDVGWNRIDDNDAWNAPLVRDHFPPELRVELVRLCRERHELLSWAAKLPSTICHQDVWPNNVFESGDRTTLIDWAFAGYGHVGTDPGNLVTDSCGDLLQPASSLPELDDATTNGYREGMRDAGWNGDFRMARLGVCVMAAKWSWLVPHMLRLAAADEHAVYGDQAVDSNELFAERAAMLAYNVKLATEARALAVELGIA